MDVPRKPSISNSHPALGQTQCPPERGCQVSSDASIRTARPFEHHPYHKKAQSMSISHLPNTAMPLPGIVVTQHPTQSDPPPPPPPPKDPPVHSKPSLSLEMPTAAAPQVWPWFPEGLPTTAPTHIPSRLISPITLGSPYIAPSPGPAAETSSIITPISTAAVPSKTTPRSPLNARVDKQGQSLRLSPAIIQRAPPWPIMSLPAIPKFQALTLSPTSPQASPFTATPTTSRPALSPLRVRRASTGLSLSPSSASPSTRRPNPSRLSTMPTLPIHGGERPQVRTPPSTQNRNDDHENDLAQEMDEDEMDDEDEHRDAAMSGQRSSGSGRHGGDWEVVEMEVSGRPSMDSIDEDGRWTPSPSPSPMSSSSPSRARTPLDASSGSASLSGGSTESLVGVLKGMDTLLKPELGSNAGTQFSAPTSSNLLLNATSIHTASSGGAVPAATWGMNSFASASETMRTPVASSVLAAKLASGSAAPSSSASTSTPPIPASPSLSAPAATSYFNYKPHPHSRLLSNSSSSGSWLEGGIDLQTPRPHTVSKALSASTLQPGASSVHSSKPESSTQAPRTRPSAETSRTGASTSTPGTKISVPTAQHLRAATTPVDGGRSGFGGMVAGQVMSSGMLAGSGSLAAGGSATSNQGVPKSVPWAHEAGLGQYLVEAWGEESAAGASSIDPGSGSGSSPGLPHPSSSARERLRTGPSSGAYVGLRPDPVMKSLRPGPSTDLPSASSLRAQYDENVQRPLHPVSRTRLSTEQRTGPLDGLNAVEKREGRKPFFHQPSRSMINLSLVSSPLVNPFKAKETSKDKGKAREVHTPSSGTPQPNGSATKSVKRRQSMPSMAAQPPSYISVQTGEEEERELLPRYSNDIFLMAQMPRKVEFTEPGVLSRDRKWRRVWCVLEGTKFGVYRVKGVKSVWEGVVGAGDVTAASRKGAAAATGAGTRSQREEEEAWELDMGRVRKVEEETRSSASQRSGAASTFLMPHSSSPSLSPPPSSSNMSSTPSGGRRRSSSMSSTSPTFERPDGSLLIREYTLQHAESGLGTDYTKRQNVIRVRMEGEQFLLQAKDVEDVVEWIEVRSPQLGVG